MNDLADLKERIRDNFSDSVSYYDDHASLQKQVASRLFKALEPWQYSIEEGPILEIGAGTGFFTNYLVKVFKDRELIISDLSDEMIRYCRAKFNHSDKITFRTLDAENESWPESKYALIAGNYVAQWFESPGQTLSKIAKSLEPGGLMLLSFPASESFSNWKKYCLELGLPYTGNVLPDLEQVVIELSMGPHKVDYYEDDMFDTFDSVFDFFRHLKKTGTATNVNQKQLNPKQFQLLNKYWLEQDGGKINIQYHTAFLAVKRNFES